MFDSITILSAVSLASGVVALVATFVSVLVAGWLSIQNRPLNQAAHLIFGFTQLALMAQMLTAVLFLALDMTQTQSLVYYLAGFTAVAGFMLFYWWPTTIGDVEGARRKTRRAMVTAVVAFLVAVTGLTVGADVAYMAAEPTPVTPLQVKEFNASSWTDRPAQRVFCLGCDNVDKTTLQEMGPLAPASLVRFVEQAPAPVDDVSLPTAVLELEESEEEQTDESARLNHPLYTLIAFIGIQR